MKQDLAATLDGLKSRFKPGVIAQKTTYYLSLGDAAAEKWTVILTPTTCEVTPGKTDNADCVLKTSGELFRKLLAGTWKPNVMDFMSGKIKTNDLDRLKRLQDAFGL
jgi:long-chain acyl-CoA synthetase